MSQNRSVITCAECTCKAYLAGHKHTADFPKGDPSLPICIKCYPKIRKKSHRTDRRNAIGALHQVAKAIEVALLATTYDAHKSLLEEWQTGAEVMMKEILDTPAEEPAIPQPQTSAATEAAMRGNQKDFKPLEELKPGSYFQTVKGDKRELYQFVGGEGKNAKHKAYPYDQNLQVWKTLVTLPPDIKVIPLDTAALEEIYPHVTLRPVKHDGAEAPQKSQPATA
jgi:hypothetical protein